MDFATQARVPKLSAAFYRDVVAKKGLGYLRSAGNQVATPGTK
jgi:hypothetical protein